MNEQYVTFETAKLLKEKGFDWGCCSYWCVFPNGDRVHTDYGNFANHNGNETDKFVSRPTQALACRWLREEYYIDILPLVRHVNKFAGELPIKEYSYRIYDSEGSVRISSRDWFRAYEKSVEAALEYALKNVI